MPKGLRRVYNGRDLHYVTCSCYRRRPLLGTAKRRDAFARILEQVRQRYRFVVVGYVVMPEHFHLLMSEPEVSDPSKVMQVLKQRVACRLLAKPLRRPLRRGWEQSELWPFEPEPHFWQRRFYAFNVWSRRKRQEKLAYMHWNPVRRGLVSGPELWRWSSYRAYAYGEVGPVKVDQGWQPARLRRIRPAA